jgi:hypothetical protein
VRRRATKPRLPESINQTVVRPLSASMSVLRKV